MKHSVYRKLLAFLIIFSLLLPVAADAVVAPENAVSKVEGASNEISAPADSGQLIEAVSAAELTRGSQILNYIDETVLTANKHTARLPEEETLSSYAFQNQDGTKTVYYMDKEVKFRDETGRIVEKNISLASTLNGFTTVSNDVGLLLPNDPADGISMSYEGYDITIVPQGGALSKTAQNNGTSVVYPDYFGAGMSLMYTPSLDGLKEDIVLSRYTGVTVFTFRLFTDGLYLYQENGRSYLAASETAEMRIDMGDVVAFDARGRFSVGTMEVETVAAAQEYLLTLTVDEEFLTDATTTYPVSIDPTLTVSDNTHGAGAIEDITIYSGVPSANCDWTYLHCGYYSSTYKVARTMFRLTGLISSSEYQSANVANIKSVEFHIQEATGTAALPVHIYSNAGSSTWTETGATWNNSGHVLGTVYATVSPGVNQAVSYDITNLVKAWKNGTESAQAGFILVSSNETSLDKAFYSSETATTSYRSYVVMNYDVGNSFADAVGLNSGKTVSVNIAAANDKQYFEFTPLVTGFHTIKSSNSTGDPKVWLYNSDYAELTSGDDNSADGSLDFSLTYHFVQGVTYYVAAGQFGSETGTYDFIISSKPSVETLITSSAAIGTGCSVSINAAYAAKYYKIEVPTAGFYFIQSSLEVGDAMIWVYNSALSRIAMDEDNGGNGKFRVEVYFEKETPYYIAVGHEGAATGTYGFTALMPITVPGGINHLQNVGSECYLDIHGPVEQELVHQWSLHKGAQEKWDIQLQSNGYYTIQSQYDKMYYLGISSTSVGENNVVLLSSVTDSALWNIYGTSDGKLLIEPKTALGKVICVPDAYEGTELQLGWMSSAVASRNRWRIGVQWDVVLEGQQMEDWCWAASARMLASAYTTVPSERSQSAAVSVAAAVSSNSGTNEDAVRAANYYSSGSVSSSDYNFTLVDNYILSEEKLRKVLDYGDVLYITRGHYNVYNVQYQGHASVIVGYTTNVIGMQLEYQFIIFDPWPENPPNPWPTYATPTEGQIITASYEWICNERKATDMPDDISYASIWNGFISVYLSSIDYTDSTEMRAPDWN